MRKKGCEIFDLMLFIVVAFICSVAAAGWFRAGSRFWVAGGSGTVVGAAGAETVWMAAPHVVKALAMGLWGAGVMAFVAAWLASGQV